MGVIYHRLELFGKQGLSKEEIREIEFLLKNCTIIELTTEIKSITKQLLQQVHIKLPDAIIAATSLYLDLPLISADEGFTRISDLKFVHLEL